MLEALRKIFSSIGYALTHDPPSQTEFVGSSSPLGVQHDRALIKDIESQVKQRRFLRAAVMALEVGDRTDSGEEARTGLMRRIVDAAFDSGANGELRQIATDPKLVEFLDTARRDRLRSLGS